MITGLSQIDHFLGLALLCLIFTFSGVSAQELNYNPLNFKPSSFSSEINADGRMGFAKNDPGFGIDQIRWSNNLSLKNNLSLQIDLKSSVEDDAYWYEFDRRSTKLSQFYLQYSKSFLVIKKFMNVNIRMGKLEYYPSYTSARQIIDNIDDFIKPPSYFGASFDAGMNFIDAVNFSGYLSGISGDINGLYKGGIKNAYLSLHPRLKNGFGLDISAGKFEGTSYAFNEASLSYNHTFNEIVKVKVKAGKLIGLDETPYGIHLGIEGYFKYIMLGGSYERRINQMNDVRYLLFYWKILNPPEVVDFLNSFQLIYDTNRDVLRFNIPFLTINLN